jgi:hypothetical protein
MNLNYLHTQKTSHLSHLCKDKTTTLSLQDINDTTTEPAMAHVIKIGKIHALTAGFGQVNTNDNQSCVKGLHLGGHYYVKSYNGVSSYLVDCLVAPEDIDCL